jgi:hypothetical protein
MRHNYETAVREALKALVIDATGDGESDMNALATALHKYAHTLDEFRQTMMTSCVTRCEHCQRYWEVQVTVKEERDARNMFECPACFNARLPEKRAEAARAWPGRDYMLPTESRHKVYRYLSEEEVRFMFGE